MFHQYIVLHLGVPGVRKAHFDCYVVFWFDVHSFVDLAKTSVSDEFKRNVSMFDYFPVIFGNLWIFLFLVQSQSLFVFLNLPLFALQLHLQFFDLLSVEVNLAIGNIIAGERQLPFDFILCFYQFLFCLFEFFSKIFEERALLKLGAVCVGEVSQLRVDLASLLSSYFCQFHGGDYNCMIGFWFEISFFFNFPYPLVSSLIVFLLQMWYFFIFLCNFLFELLNLMGGIGGKELWFVSNRFRGVGFSDKFVKFHLFGLGTAIDFSGLCSWSDTYSSSGPFLRVCFFLESSI